MIRQLPLSCLSWSYCKIEGGGASLNCKIASLKCSKLLTLYVIESNWFAAGPCVSIHWFSFTSKLQQNQLVLPVIFAWKFHDGALSKTNPSSNSIPPYYRSCGQIGWLCLSWSRSIVKHQLYCKIEAGAAVSSSTGLIHMLIVIIHWVRKDAESMAPWWCMGVLNSVISLLSYCSNSSIMSEMSNGKGLNWHLGRKQLSYWSSFQYDCFRQ